MSFPSNITAENQVEDETGLAFVALGSNLHTGLGSPEKIVQLAMDALENLSRKPLRRSSLWLSKPQDCPERSPDFVNAVVAISPLAEETPQTLLTKLLELELVFGRERRAGINAPRSLDLDLICYGPHVLQIENLVLPHPAAQYRDFVLTPLAEIAPDLVLPGQTMPVLALAAQASSTSPALIQLLVNNQ